MVCIVCMCQASYKLFAWVNNLLNLCGLVREIASAFNLVNKLVKSVCGLVLSNNVQARFFVLRNNLTLGLVVAIISSHSDSYPLNISSFCVQINIENNRDSKIKNITA